MAHSWINPFARAAAELVAEATGLSPEDFAVGTPPKPELGDFAVGCFPAAKAMKRSPADIAKHVVDNFGGHPLMASAQATGPFVNFSADPTALFRHLFAVGVGATKPIAEAPGAGKTICIDFSSPNISKQLAYHHIRSTVIGHALAELHRALGYQVVGINHLGDWGTTHGMLLAACEKWGEPAPLTIETLNQLYVRFRAEMKDDASLEQLARQWFKRLEDGEPSAREQWQRFKDISWQEFCSAYELLGIEFDEVKGESEYMDDVPKVLELLERKGLSSISEGALVVDLEAEGMPPLLLRKQDGATLYGTRDLAAAIYRHKTHDFSKNYYVVDRGQGLHFKQVFTVLKKAGFEWADDCQHVSFGLVRLGGKKTATRNAGGQKAILLKDVFREATDRVWPRVKEANPDMSEEQSKLVAEHVGIGAVVFANLVTQRDKDVDFEWEQILAVDGDSGPYVQYSHARCASILRKSTVEPSLDADASKLGAPLEKALARRLVEYPDVVARCTNNCEPHLLCRYLLDLGADFARFYTAGNQDKALRVLADDQELAQARVSLVAAAKRVLAHGLSLLGLNAPDAM